MVHMVGSAFSVRFIQRGFSFLKVVASSQWRKAFLVVRRKELVASCIRWFHKICLLRDLHVSL